MLRIAHTEFISENPKATADFIRKIFGWNVEKWDDPKNEYYIWNYPGEKTGGGGIGRVSDRQVVPGPHIDLYVDVEDIKATIGMAEELGATLLLDKTPVGSDMGYYAVLRAPGGITLSLWEKNPVRKSEPEKTASQKK